MKVAVIVSDKSDALFYDKQVLVGTKDGYYLGVVYCCTDCGTKNPHARWIKEMSKDEMDNFKGLHEELKQLI